MEDLFREKLKNRLLEKGYDNITEDCINKLLIYKNMLLEWNNKINLTAITDDDGIIEKHFVDCLEITKYINKENKILDIGTGAGFPGIVIAIYFNNDIDITLMDSLNKRLVFLEEVKNKLNLSNIKIIHARAEEKAHDSEFREKFDVVVSRAVANLNSLTEYSIAYLKNNGKCLFMKADSIFQEIDNCKNCFKVLKCEISDVYKYLLEIDNQIFTRYIVIINKRETTSNKYPRIFSKIKNNPL